MPRFALTAALLLSLPAAALAQQAPGTPWQMPRADEPPAAESLPPGEAAPENGLPGMLDGFMNELFERAQPHLEGLARDMGGLMEDYRPFFEEMSKLVDDIGNYELPPERLPNGDILIRRKADAPPPPPLEDLERLVPDSGEPAPPQVPRAGPQIEL